MLRRPRSNRLHENVVWSQRDNFVSVPTDCPQRDERLGWTGDAQAFAATASTLFDAEAFWRSWLRDLALDQDPTLGVPSVVPDVVLDGEPRFGRAGWADAATIVPWAVYESYGDLERPRASSVPSMRRWVESLAARRGPDGLLVRQRCSSATGWIPDAPSDRPWEAKAEFDVHRQRVLRPQCPPAPREPPGRLAAPRLEAHARSVADDVAPATWDRWRDHARDDADRLRGRAPASGSRPARSDLRSRAALARLVREADGRVATGFLGTPLVLPALAEFGHFDERYLMLLRRDDAVVAVPGRAGRHDRLGALGCDPCRTARSTRARWRRRRT